MPRAPNTTPTGTLGAGSARRLPWQTGTEVSVRKEASFQVDRLSEGAVQGGLDQPRGNEASWARRGSVGCPGSGWSAGSRWGRPWAPAWPLCVLGPQVVLPAGRPRPGPAACLGCALVPEGS